MAFNSSGALYISDRTNQRVRRIGENGIIRTIAGNGLVGDTGDGPALEARIAPTSLTFDSRGSLYVVTSNSKVRKISPDGGISLFAGKGTGTGLIRNQGDGGPAIEATLNEPGAVAFDAQGNTYIADSANARIRKVDSSGVISTFGPVGVQGKDYYNSVVVTPNGNLYLTWTHTEPPNGSAAFLVRVGADGSFTKVAGNGVLCSQIRTEYPDGPTLNAPLCSISGMSSDSAGNVYITGAITELS